ncbi:DUF3567 domain-containing protein [Limnobacter humi]|uniref:DUF3567 domain-containing protein n=1 Tax=Limnobacter humi TaxID=1778671 RepID=A0ABT1WDI2_9BURK|nr:DUF3567 family protein [Limnobacter humi]MCQ8895578.1 DUF3567 domain-containing protein [Limnobacter humi]
MLMMIDSPYYCVVDLVLSEGQPSYGIEIVDKNNQRELFLHGDAADRFREQVRHLAKQEPDLDDIEAFIEGYKPWMQTRVTLH